MQSFAASYSVMSDFANPRAIACQAPLSMGFPRQEHCRAPTLVSAAFLYVVSCLFVFLFVFGEG